METKKSYFNLYIKYKTKYLKIKNKQTGGSQDLIQSHFEKLTNLITQVEQVIKKLKEQNPQYQSLILSSPYIKFESNNYSTHIIEINKLVEQIKKYMEFNDIPLELPGYPFLDINELEELISKLKKELTINNLENKYKQREQIYMLDNTNYMEILDMIIVDFNIKNPPDIEQLFRSTILGYNKNYIIGYMVLFRFLIKNKIQLSTINNNITYLTLGGIFSTLNNSLNNEEYIPIIMELINQYIKIFPIKKVIQIKNPPEMEKIYGFKNSLLFAEISEKIEFIDSYDSKNRVIIYKSGIIKDEKKANFDDIKQIINTLFRIPIYIKNE
jgi:hypothetical protein